MSKKLISKISLIILVTLTLSMISTFCFAAEAATNYYNTRVTFTGNTYWLPNHKENTKPRKVYDNNKKGEGIVSIVRATEVYVTGEGWVNKDNIVETFQYITLKFDPNSDSKIPTGIKIEGEYSMLDSDNKNVLDFDGKTLRAGVEEGSTTITLKKPNGEEIKVLASNYDGVVTLSIPDKQASVEGGLEVTIPDVITVDMEGDATATLDIDKENGKITVGSEENGSITLKDKDGKEIGSSIAHGETYASAGKDGVAAGAEGTLTARLKDKLYAKLHGKADASADRDSAQAGASGDISVGTDEENSKTVVDGSAEASTDYGNAKTAEDLDPDIHLEGSVAGREPKEIDFKLPVVSGLRNLLAKLRK